MVTEGIGRLSESKESSPSSTTSTLFEFIYGEILPPVGFFFPLAFFLVLGESLLIVSSTEFKVLMSLSLGDTFFFFDLRKGLVVDGAKSESSTLEVY